jgi:CO dehydrogenase maturation factor
MTNSGAVPSLRVAVVGKGGAGKSLIAGTLARRGHHVLALDVDTLPGLALSLGLALDRVGDAGLPEDLAEQQEGRGWVLREGVEVTALVADHAIPGPDGVRFLQLGKLPGRVKPGSTTAFRVVLEEFRAEGWTLVGDLAASTRQPFFGWSDFAEVILIVAEPSAKAVLAARRLAGLAQSAEGAVRDALHQLLRGQFVPTRVPQLYGPWRRGRSCPPTNYREGACVAVAESAPAEEPGDQSEQH